MDSSAAFKHTFSSTKSPPQNKIWWLRYQQRIQKGDEGVSECEARVAKGSTLLVWRSPPSGACSSFPGGEQAFGSSLSSSAARGSITFGQRALLNPTAQSGPAGSFNARALGSGRYPASAVSAQALDLEQRSIARGGRYTVPDTLPVSLASENLLVLLEQQCMTVCSCCMQVC